MAHDNPGLRPGLLSAVPTGLNLEKGGSRADTKGRTLQENLPQGFKRPYGLLVNTARLKPGPSCRDNRPVRSDFLALLAHFFRNNPACTAR